jgi:hypothetical protein
MALLGDLANRHPLLLKAWMFRSAGAVQLADPELARTTADRVVAEAERQRAPRWIRCNTQLALGAAQLMQGHRTEGEATLLAARDLSHRCGYRWGQGTTDLMLAWNLLNDRDLAEPTAQQALRSLRGALAVFLDLSNTSDVLGVLYAGAHTLPYVARASDGVRLRAAVLQHAERVGTEHRRYVHLAGGGFEQRLDLALTPDARAAAEREGRALSWPAMLRLFSEPPARRSRPSSWPARRWRRPDGRLHRVRLHPVRLHPSAYTPSAYTASASTGASADASSAARTRLPCSVSLPFGGIPLTLAMSSIRPMPPTAPQ